MASIDRVKQPSDSPDYQPTRSHGSLIASTLVVRFGYLSMFCHDVVKPRRDPAMFKSWSLRTGYLFYIIEREKERLTASIKLLHLACCSWNREP